MSEKNGADVVELPLSTRALYEKAFATLGDYLKGNRPDPLENDRVFWDHYVAQFISLGSMVPIGAERLDGPSLIKQAVDGADLLLKLRRERFSAKEP